MTYPHEFVEKVCSEYSDSLDVRSAAVNGKYGLGVLLSRGAAMTMSPEDIVISIDSGDCRQVREDALTAVRRRGLHAEWMRIVLRSISSANEVVPSVPPPSRRGYRSRQQEAIP